MDALKQGISDVLEIFFPSLCICCGERLVTQEAMLCFSCWGDLPLTHFHKLRENKVEQLFWGRTQIEFATAFFSYKKGSRYQQILNYLKYRGLKELGEEIGRRYGLVLLESADFSSVDLIVPVPLHPKKQKKRGYNQSEYIAKGISKAMDKPFSSGYLSRKVYTGTQTRKNRYERWTNVEGIFEAKNHKELEDKHILLVDDVVTTGSTLEACAHPLLKIPNTKVSVATLAYADI